MHGKTFALRHTEILLVSIEESNLHQLKGGLRLDFQQHAVFVVFLDFDKFGKFLHSKSPLLCGWLKLYLSATHILYATFGKLQAGLEEKS